MVTPVGTAVVTERAVVASSTPLTYSLTFDPSYVLTTWYHVPVTAVVVDSALLFIQGRRFAPSENRVVNLLFAPTSRRKKPSSATCLPPWRMTFSVPSAVGCTHAPRVIFWPAVNPLKDGTSTKSSVPSKLVDAAWTVTLPLPAVSVRAWPPSIEPDKVMLASVVAASVVIVTSAPRISAPVKATGPAVASAFVDKFPFSVITLAITEIPPSRVVTAGRLAVPALVTVRPWIGALMAESTMLPDVVV